MSKLRGRWDTFPVTNEDLTIEQATRLRDQIAARLRWLTKLETRLKRLGFRPKDKLQVATIAASAAMQDLHVAAHYASCKHGVGKTGDSEESAQRAPSSARSGPSDTS